MIENELKRIADALERMAAQAGAVVATTVPVRDKMNPSFEDLDKMRATGAAPAPAAEPRKRGRPAKVAPAPEPEPEPEPKLEVIELGDLAPEAGDDSLSFLDDAAPGPEPTIEDVRAALIACRKRTNEATARKALKEAGGVDVMSKLQPDKFRAVIEAANK